MHVESDGDVSYAPMLMEFVETNVSTGKPRLLHMIRITGWPAYLQPSLQLQGKYYKDTETDTWTTYHTRNYGGTSQSSGWWPAQ